MIALENVSKSFGARLILKKVSASFKEGEITLLTGENGAGKSTLLKMLAGLIRPDTGKVLFEKECPVGYLGHESFLYPALTAMENLSFWSKAAGAKAGVKELKNMLAHVGLAAFADTRSGVFSRGMLQRLSLARVLLLNPGLFLLDEPATGLDSPSRDMLDKEILLARERGACIVWVSHDTERDAKLATRMLRIEKKRLVDLGLKSTEEAESKKQEKGGNPC